MVKEKFVKTSKSLKMVPAFTLILSAYYPNIYSQILFMFKVVHVFKFMFYVTLESTCVVPTLKGEIFANQ